MTVRKATIVSLDDWLTCPAGRYFLAWEQAQFDAVVADLFGYHALQLGFPQLFGLRENRIMRQGIVLEQKTHLMPARAQHIWLTLIVYHLLAKVSIWWRCRIRWNLSRRLMLC